MTHRTLTASVAGLLLLLAAWALAAPAFSGPDEAGHYLRALEVSRGHVFPEPVDVAASDRITPEMAAWLSRTTTLVDVPAQLSARPYLCRSKDPTRPAACLEDVEPFPEDANERAGVGTYEPAAHVPTAAAFTLTSTTIGALATARGIQVVLTVLLVIAIARWLAPLARGGLLLGGAVLLSPQVVHLSSVVGPTWLEVLGSVAVFAIAVTARSRRDLLVFVMAFAVVVWSRQIGSAFALYATAMALATRRVVGLPVADVWWPTRERWWSLAGAAAVIASVLAYELSLGAGGTSVSVAAPVLADVLAALPGLYSELVGAFNALEMEPPAGVVALWATLYAALVAGAVTSASERRALHATVVTAAILSPALLWIVVWVAGYHASGFALQGRHAAPVAAIGVASLTVLASGAGSWARARTVGSGVVVAWTIGSAVAWWSHARRHAVGTEGPWWFLADPVYDPAGGWWPATALVAAGLVLIAVALVAHTTGSRSHPPLGNR